MHTVSQTGNKFLPYGRQHVTNTDIEAVVEVLKSDWLTQGPNVDAFENRLAQIVGSKEAVACSSGTAALHLAVLAMGLGPDDAVVTSPITFLASANCARYAGAEVRFADVDPRTGLMDPQSLEEVIRQDKTHKIRAIIPVHFAGQPVDLATIHGLASNHGARVLDDACHAIGGSYRHDNTDISIGGSPHANLTAFSFHPVKHVAMGEGGAVTTNDTELANRLRLFRNHGMQREQFALSDMAYGPDGKPNPWYYEMHQLGYNYRLTDIQAALGLSQLERVSWSVNRRRELATVYRRLLSETFEQEQVYPLNQSPDVTNAYHLYVVQIDYQKFGTDRASVMNRLRQEGIGTQVHYIPIHLQPYYRDCSGTAEAGFPGAEEYYSRALSIPMYPDLTDDDCHRVIDTLRFVLTGER